VSQQVCHDTDPSLLKGMGGGKGKKDVNAKLTTNFINILKYMTNHLKQNQQTRLQNQQSPMQNQRSPMQNQQSFTELSLDGVQKIDIT
jgi:hypothetical protein